MNWYPIGTRKLNGTEHAVNRGGGAIVGFVEQVGMDAPGKGRRAVAEPATHAHHVEVGGDERASMAMPERVKRSGGLLPGAEVTSPRIRDGEGRAG